MTADVLLAAAGIALVALALGDALWTTLWVDGSGGPLTGRLSTLLWRMALPVLRRRDRALSLVGPLVLVVTVVTWVLLLWAGWVLLFASQPQALPASSGPGFADWTGRIWFVGYTMFTVGNGDFSPSDGFWQIVSGLVAFTGMGMVTLAVTYLLNVLSAVTAKRAFADQVAGLGCSAEDFVLAGWNGRDLSPLDRQLTALASQLAGLTEKYLAYPVLQYYHAVGEQKSPVKAASVLDDSLTLLLLGVVPEQRPDPAALTSARSAVTSFLEDTREAASTSPAPDVPPPPSLARLRAAGIATVPDDEFADALGDLDDRRRVLLGLVRDDAWEWAA